MNPMTTKNNRLIVWVSLLLFCLISLPGCAAGWDYPRPDAMRNVKDISFYKTAESSFQLPDNIPAGRPRSVILLIGDGMGANHIALARHRAVGRGGRLWMETLPVAGLVRTYSADNAVTDSAAAATALACGVKTNNGVLGIDANGKVYSSILEVLSKKGWRTGLAATSTITHATPAGFASHVSSRAKEEQIARQMLDSRVDILFGGGRKYWLPAAIGGARSDGANLLKQAKSAGWQIIDAKQQLDALLPCPAIGLFADDALTTYDPEPAIAEMTAAAIKLLSAENKDWFAPEPKFFLMVEGSQIDWACHKNNADNCVRQTLLFDLAVKEALDFAGRDKQTLVIVTADHETGGLVLTADKNGKEITARWKTKDHTAADVPLFAFGPGCGKFSGCIDNTDIPKKIADLLNLADFPKVLEQKNTEENSPQPAAPPALN